WSLLVGATGLMVMALAGFVQLAAHGDHGGKPSLTQPDAAATASARSEVGGLTIGGPGDITVLRRSYGPGQSSGWHSHRGIHAVAVLSGAISVYDAQCTATVYGPGEPYIGGQQLHLVRNEGASAADLVVTYLNPTTLGSSAILPQQKPNC